MGFFNIFKGQFIDVIEWPDENPQVLVHRFDRHNNEIKMGARLIVRPGQKAIFVNEGKIADHFGPGTYKLHTKNMPI
ncbi:MAG: SPFH domain-containing protein, partial [Victivallaceae bacterium]|nr:SPFH domain-containing protein [Victivallaceae bacterium]